MALTILPSSPSFGSVLGTGLGQGLQMLAQHKFQSILGEKQKQGSLAGLQALGFEPEEAQQISGMDPFIQREIVKRKLQAPQQQDFANALSSLLGGQEAVQPQFGGVGPQITQEEFTENAIGAPGLSPEEEKIQDPSKQGLTFLTGGLTQQQATELAKLGLKKEEASEAKMAAHYKATQPYRKEVLDATKSAKEDLRNLTRMEELESKGDLDSAGYVEFLERSGLNIPALMQPDSQEFQKLSANFLKNAKQYFGARVTNFEIEQFLKTIPTLSQSPEGRRSVIANLKNMSHSALEYNKALKDVIAENRGVPPFDLQERVDDKVEKKMDKLAEIFKKDLARKVPPAQSSYLTGLQAALGSVLGAPGSILKALGGLRAG